MEYSWRNDAKRSEEGKRAGDRASSMPPRSRVLPAYRYRPLPGGSIRLLQLMPHKDEYAPVQCHLVDFSLLDPGSGKRPHPYEALSYAWGSPEKPRLVYLETGYLAITENLYAALLRLRDHSFPRIIWADTICIDQDDLKERGYQVQLMAMIYAKATRVVVWLEEVVDISLPFHGEAITNGDRALEAICAAAEGQSADFLEDEISQKAILALFQRSWFRRIWVLQEVSAARQVSIMTRTMEIDGFAFCSGLKTLDFACKDPDMQSRIGSAVYLIKTAVLRSRNVIPPSGRFSLNISPLNQLIDMYQTREATDRRDKVYALLGMSSDGYSVGGLSTNYDILWKDLFRQFVNFGVGPNRSVEIRGEKEIVAVIKAKGHVIGQVTQVLSTGAWDDRQIVEIKLSTLPIYADLRCSYHAALSWTIQTTAKPIRARDLVCILEGASAATIIRAYEDYCAVIAIAIIPINTKPVEEPFSYLLTYIQSMRSFPCDFLLLWDWEMSWGEPQDGANYKSFLQGRALEHAGEELEDPLDNAVRLHCIGRMLIGIEPNLANIALQKAIKIYERAVQREHPDAFRLPKFLKWCDDDWQARRLGLAVDILFGKEDWLSIDSIYWSARSSEMGCLSTDSIAFVARCFDHGLMALLFEQQGDQISITEEMLEGAVRNEWCAKEMTALLLNRPGDQVIITKRVLIAARNGRQGSAVMALLLDEQRDHISVTKEALKAALLSLAVRRLCR